MCPFYQLQEKKEFTDQLERLLNEYNCLLCMEERMCLIDCIRDREFKRAYDQVCKVSPAEWGTTPYDVQQILMQHAVYVDVQCSELLWKVRHKLTIPMHFTR